MKKGSSELNGNNDLPQGWPNGRVIGSFMIPGKLEGINEYIRACRSNPICGARMKKAGEDICLWAVVAGAKNMAAELPLDRPVLIHYLFIETKFRRDLDNISGFTHKVFQDALTEAGVLKDDNFTYIKGFTDTFMEGSLPRIEVRLTEA